MAGTPPFADSGADCVTCATLRQYCHGRVANTIGTDVRIFTDFVEGETLSQGQGQFCQKRGRARPAICTSGC